MLVAYAVARRADAEAIVAGHKALSTLKPTKDQPRSQEPLPKDTIELTASAFAGIYEKRTLEITLDVPAVAERKCRVPIKNGSHDEVAYRVPRRWLDEKAHCRMLHPHNRFFATVCREEAIELLAGRRSPSSLQPVQKKWLTVGRKVDRKMVYVGREVVWPRSDEQTVLEIDFDLPDKVICGFFLTIMDGPGIIHIPRNLLDENACFRQLSDDELLSRCKESLNHVLLPPDDQNTTFGQSLQKSFRSGRLSAGDLPPLMWRALRESGFIS